VITISDSESPYELQQKNTQRTWCAGLTVTDKCDIEIGAPLTSDVMMAAQKLLQQQHPLLEGLEDTLLDQCTGFKPTHNETLQIHYTRTNHWVISARIGTQTIVVLDSFYDHLTVGTKAQLCDLYRFNMEKDGHLRGYILTGAARCK